MTTSMNKAPKSVDAYIASAPKEVRPKLLQLRRIIKTAAPDAVERISYGMPYYGYKGRLAYFRLAKTHVGLYIPPPIIAEYRDELKKYGTSTATVRFPLNETLPVKIIQTLIKARITRNDGRGKKASR